MSIAQHRAEATVLVTRRSNDTREAEATVLMRHVIATSEIPRYRVLRVGG